jgi:hypothetical protein
MNNAQKKNELIPNPSLIEMAALIVAIIALAKTFG